VIETRNNSSYFQQKGFDIGEWALTELLEAGGASFRPGFQERSQSSTSEWDAEEAASSITGREAEDQKAARELSIRGHAAIVQSRIRSHHHCNDWIHSAPARSALAQNGRLRPHLDSGGW